MKTMKYNIIIASCFLSLATFISVIRFWGFQPLFYQYEYKKNHTAMEISMTEEDLNRSMNTLLSYIQNDRNDMIITAKVNGVLQTVYNERETLHMVDVKNLYHDAMKFMWISYVIAVILYLYGYVKQKKNYLLDLQTYFMHGMGIFLSFIFAIAVYASVNFEAFWIQFHELFFNNDLYLLDPSSSLLIRMVPQSFFFDLVFCIIVSYVIIVALGYSLMKYYKKRSLKYATRSVV